MSEIEERIQYLNCGDSAIAVQFGEAADIAVNLRVRALDLALKENPIPGDYRSNPDLPFRDDPLRSAGDPLFRSGEGHSGNAAGGGLERHSAEQ